MEKQLVDVFSERLDPKGTFLIKLFLIVLGSQNASLEVVPMVRYAGIGIGCQALYSYTPSWV
jgi:hypothetical protein